MEKPMQVYGLGITQAESSSYPGRAGQLGMISQQCAHVVMKANCIVGCRSKSRASVTMISFYI